MNDERQASGDPVAATIIQLSTGSSTACTRALTFSLALSRYRHRCDERFHVDWREAEVLTCDGGRVQVVCLSPSTARSVRLAPSAVTASSRSRAYVAEFEAFSFD